MSRSDDVVFLTPKVGFLKIEFTDEELKPIREEIQQIQDDWDLATTHNHRLAGAIEKEYTLSAKTNNYIQSLIFDHGHLKKLDDNINVLKSINILTKDVPATIQNSWVNYMKKYEYNPIHNHDGVYSYVLYTKIPYDINEEKLNSSTKNSRSNTPGHLVFVYDDCGITTCSIPTDRTYENHMILFPASLWHCVHPFYTSDEYRISISGNIKLDIQ